MFSTITWQQYLFFIGFVLIAYYIAVAIKYFKWELLALAGIHKEENTRFSDVTVPNFTATNQGEFGEEREVDLSPVLQDFRDEISAFITEASTDKLSETEVVHGLHCIIAKYPVLNTINQTMSRNEIIAQELSETHFATISYQEL